MVELSVEDKLTVMATNAPERGSLHAEYLSMAEEVRQLRAENEALRRALRQIATHRRDCHAYDEDMGHEPRMFLDEEEWDLIEAEASRALAALEVDDE